MNTEIHEYISNIETTKDNSNIVFSDYYSIKPPFGYTGIYISEDSKNTQYVKFEPYMSDKEIELLEDIKKSIIEKVNMPYDLLDDDEGVKNYLKKYINKYFNKNKHEQEIIKKIEYFITRDFLGYGKIDLLVNDDKVEDISCNGLNTPIYVWHRDYESIPTNIVYESEKELRSAIIRLAYKSGVHISVSNPIIEGTLPNGYRIHLTLDEVSKRGHTFTIRKLRKNPFTLIDLIKKGTLDLELAAYIWCLVENQRSIMVSGSTGSGKTTLLNSICTFIKPDHKVITIEDVRELTLNQNWIPMITRTSFQPNIKDITLFDLLKSALRQRPDFIVLGEIRGDEAYTLFQAIATGHGGICSIHSDSVESTIKRLESRPLNIPKSIIPLMNVIIQIKRITENNKVLRKVTEVSEIVGNDPKGKPILKERYKWNSATNEYEFIKPDPKTSYLLKKISEHNHKPINEILEGFEMKKQILYFMVNNDINKNKEVSKIVSDYYANPIEIIERISDKL
jgi:flagellar protein FlaI